MELLFTLRPIQRVTVRCYANGCDHRGATRYRVEVIDRGRVMFSRDDGPLRGAFSPLWSDDGAEAKAAVLEHVGMKPGDTDAEFFDDYSENQLAWCQQHGEELCAVAFLRYRQHAET